MLLSDFWNRTSTFQTSNMIIIVSSYIGHITFVLNVSTRFQNSINQVLAEQPFSAQALLRIPTGYLFT